MRIEQYVTCEWAGLLTKRLITRTRRHLKHLGGAILSDDDAALRSVWDEICVQEKAGHSPFWPAYEHQIDQFLYYQVDRLSEAARLALWAQTPVGRDWVYDHHGDNDGETTAPLDLDAVVQYLKLGVLAEAEQEKNSRVDEYLQGPEEP